MKNKRLKIILTAVPILLLIPFIAMQFTDAVVWTSLDFIVMGFLLLSTGLLFDFVLRKVAKKKYRIILFIAILVGFLVLWAELVVGILGHLLPAIRKQILDTTMCKNNNQNRFEHKRCRCLKFVVK